MRIVVGVFVGAEVGFDVGVFVGALVRVILGEEVGVLVGLEVVDQRVHLAGGSHRRAVRG